jgi:O-antigen ligase
MTPTTARPPDSLGPGPARLSISDGERWALVLVVMSGVAVVPGGLNQFVLPKLAVFAAALALAAIAPPRGRLSAPVKRLLAAAGALLLLAALTSATPLQQLLGRPPRYEGAIGLTLYTGALFAGARLLGPQRDAASLACLTRLLSLAAIAAGSVAAVEALGGDPLGVAPARPGSLVGNASDLAAWALLALGPLVADAASSRRVLPALGATGASIALLVSGSRGGLLGAAVLLATLVWLSPSRERRILGAVAVAVLLAASAFPSTRERILDSGTLAQRTVDGRLMLWSESLSLIEAHPLLGVGPNGWIDAIGAYHTERYERTVGPSRPADSPHNWVLQAASAGGLPLALLAIALASLTLTSGVQAARRTCEPDAAVIRGLVAALAGWAVALLFHFTSPATTPLAALFAGALLARPIAYGPSRASAIPFARAGAAAAWAAAGIILVAGALAEVPLRSAVIAAASGRTRAAQADFRLARALRPWDPGVAAIAAHAYAQLLDDGVQAVAAQAESWSQLELGAYPDSVPALEDAATAAAARGDRRLAAALLERAALHDPHDGQILETLARLRGLSRRSRSAESAVP